jgi:hypothetical protein
VIRLALRLDDIFPAAFIEKIYMSLECIENDATKDCYFGIAVAMI